LSDSGDVNAEQHDQDDAGDNNSKGHDGRYQTVAITGETRERVKESLRGLANSLPSAKHSLPFDLASRPTARREFAASRCGSCIK
jgi:hypothetical protein